MAIFCQVQFGGLKGISASGRNRVSILGNRGNRLLQLWPGLPDAWLRGRLSGLLIALGFGIVLQAAVVASVLWPLWLGSVTNAVVWLVVVLYWLGGALPQLIGGTLSTDEYLAGDIEGLDLFRQAQAEYLSGNWFQAEQRLQELLAVDESDTDVRLMLATLYRRLGRLVDAEKQLGLVDEFDRAGKWHWEVAQELDRLGNRQTELDRVESTGVVTRHVGNQTGAA